MGDKRMIKKDCYQDMLDDGIIGVEAVVNQINKIKGKKGIFDDSIIERDLLRGYANLELSLASLCILLRKMCENRFIEIDPDLRRDINSVIHSNKFEFFDEDIIYVYSQKGREDISLSKIIQFSKSVL